MTACECYCHSNPAATCTVDGGYGVGCGPHDVIDLELGDACERCGARRHEQHRWEEGDCLLPHRRHVAATIGHLCVGCVDRHRAWLDEIVELYATLPHVVALGSVPDNTADHKRTKRPASPAQMRLIAWAMINDAGRLFARGERQEAGQPLDPDYLRGIPDPPPVLGSWAQYCIDSQGITMHVEADALSTNATLLKLAADHIAGQPWVDEYDAEVGWIRRTLRNAHGITDPQPLGKCITVTNGRDCTGRVWRDPDTSQDPKCDRCARRYKPLDLVRLRKMEDTA